MLKQVYEGPGGLRLVLNPHRYKRYNDNSAMVHGARPGTHGRYNGVLRYSRLHVRQRNPNRWPLSLTSAQLEWLRSLQPKVEAIRQAAMRLQGEPA